MKIERKDVKKIKLRHNKKLFWLIIALMIVLIFLIIYIKSEKQKAGKETTEKECEKEEDCTPASCCHPDSCVVKEKAPVCKGMICSMVCSGPLDCGAGSCGCAEGKCQIIPNK